ncbi:MAG TPA: carbohydrate ABC transporter permease [Rhizobium sp.]
MTHRLQRSVKGLVIWCGVLTVVSPLVWMIITAIRPKYEALRSPLTLVPSTITWENFGRILNETPFVANFQTSMIVSLLTTVFVIALSVPASYALARFRFPGNKILSAAVLMVYMLPGTVVVVPLYLIFVSLGLSGTLLSLILTYSAFALPFAILLLVEFFSGMASQAEDAARLDGASQMEVLIEIALPQTLPAIGAVSMFTFIAAYNEYLFALIFISDPERTTLPVGIVASAKTTFDVDWAGLMAASVMMSVPVIIVVALLQRVILQSFSVGGVKT